MVPNGPRWAVVIWTCNKVINLLTQMIQSAARWRRQRRGGGEGVLRHGAVGLVSCAKKETSFRTLHCQATKGTAAGIYGAAVAKQWRGGGAHSAPLCRRWQCFATAVITCPRFPLVSNIFRSFFLFLAENTEVPNCLFFSILALSFARQIEFLECFSFYKWYVALFSKAAKNIRNLKWL